jgi:hypothetical protein
VWEIEHTDQFEHWLLGLPDKEQGAIDAKIQLLAQFGPNLARPHADTVNGSKHANMKELRIKQGKQFRVLYAFDPLRRAVLLLGGDKTGDDRWYKENVPLADRLLDEHLAKLK